MRSCKEKVEHTPKHYLPPKGKVERCIRTLDEEFLRLDEVFENPENLISEFLRRHNFDRWHLGIGCAPAELYNATRSLLNFNQITNCSIYNKHYGIWIYGGERQNKNSNYCRHKFYKKVKSLSSTSLLARSALAF